MTVFFALLNQMVFLFSLIFLGLILTKAKVLPPNTATVLSKLENYLLIPALVINTLLNNFTVDRLRSAGVYFLWNCAILAVVMVIVIPLCRLLFSDKFVRNIATYGLCFSNFGFMGFCIMQALFPEIFSEYLIFTLPLWFVLYLWGVPALLIPQKEDAKGIWQRLKPLFNPMFISMLVGVVLGLCNFPFPKSILSVVSSLDDCMSPIAMLLTGMTVANIPLRKTLTDGNVYLISGIRLIAIPLLFLGVLFFVPMRWEIAVCTMCTLCAPLGLNTIIIPSAYGKDSTMASGMVLISHILACITMPVFFLLLMKMLGI